MWFYFFHFIGKALTGRRRMEYNQDEGKGLPGRADFPRKNLLYVQEMGKVNRFMNERAQASRMNDEQFEALYTRYANDVLRVSFFYLGDRQQAEDVTQDVFVRLLTHAPDLEPGKEKAWLLKVALNRCRDLWRAAWVKRVVLGSPAMELAPAPDELNERMERQELLSAIRKLPADFRDVILLHYYQGYGIAEMSQMLGVPEGTISGRLSRGRKKLEDILKESGSR